MRGYLQRMATAAARPETRVHPFVESAVGARREEWGGEVVSEQSVAGAAGVVPPTLRENAPMSGAPGQVGEARPTPARDGEAASNWAPRVGETPRRVDEDRFEPLVRDSIAGRSSEGAGFVLPTQNDEGVPDGAPGVAHPAHRDEAAMNGAPEPQRQRESKTLEFEALLQKDDVTRAGARDGGSKPMVDFAEHGASRAVESAGLLRPTLHQGNVKDGAPGQSGAGMAGAAGRMAQRRMERQAQARAERQGDEIQIHIGRIEVIAMPPAAPRPVAMPARKTQTLDEYLRRGSGRAG